MFTLRFRQLILVNETDEPVGPIGLMVHRAIVANQDLDPEDNLLTRAGVKIPHPEPYAGEPDLEHFEVFVAGILQWLSMNLLLGSSDKCTLVQLRFLGTRLTGDALEWYSCEVECYTIPTCRWDLESALVGLQKQFLHSLMHRHVSMQFNTAQ